jgi:hypothetical protein
MDTMHTSCTLINGLQSLFRLQNLQKAFDLKGYYAFENIWQSTENSIQLTTIWLAIPPMFESEKWRITLTILDINSLSLNIHQFPNLIYAVYVMPHNI